MYKQSTMYEEFILPAFLCVAGLILLAGIVPVQVELSPEADDASTEEEEDQPEDDPGAIHT